MIPLQNPRSDLSVMLPCGSHMEVKDDLLLQIHKDGGLDGGDFELCSLSIVMAGVMPFISGDIDTGDATLLRKKVKTHL